MEHRFNVEIDLEGPGNSGFYIPAEAWRWWLIQLVVQNSLTQPAATFSMTLDPTAVIDGRPLHEVIPLYSKITITATAEPYTEGTPQVILIGVVDSISFSANYGSSAPARTIQMTGRAMAGVLADQAWWHNSYLVGVAQGRLAGPAGPQGQLPPIVNIPTDAAEFFEVVPGAQSLGEQIKTDALRFLAIDPEIWASNIGRHPAYLQETAFNYFIRGGDPTTEVARLPFCRSEWNGVHISQFLRFDAALAFERSVDKQGAVIRQYLPGSMEHSSCWDLLQHFSLRYLGELYSESFGTGAGDARCQIISRKPPWAGHITYTDGGQPKLAFSNQPPPPVKTLRYAPEGSSLFDSLDSPWAVKTIKVGGDDIDGTPSLQVSHQECFNIYTVRPIGLFTAGPATGHAGGLAELLAPPVIDSLADSPSSVLKYGPRPLRVDMISIPWNEPGLAQLYIFERCVVHEVLLRQWFYLSPLFQHGTYVLRGNPKVRVGRRLFDTISRYEYYITQVSHRFTFGPASTPSYTTTATVSRGWKIDG